MRASALGFEVGASESVWQGLIEFEDNGIVDGDVKST